MKRKIWLVSAGGERISISENATKKSITISDYINEILRDVDVPLPELSREVLLKAVEFFEYHTEIDESDPLYAEHTTNLYEVNHFHLEFFNIRVKKLTKLI
ncbi:unnamed protein product [Moneuplotes crassus]|uniref:SKP1 component POZ domain-containing protein n=1 Tax=Euplotes crassus TaxID=5936 RepID=A0AAD1XWY0_EUPCR|nr:unnamed protein product [Moneuplotes crassus]